VNDAIGSELFVRNKGIKEKPRGQHGIDGSAVAYTVTQTIAKITLEHKSTVARAQ
jgi:hypothetical protein